MTTCIENFACFPQTPLELFDLYEIQYGIPTVIIFALITGIIITAIYLHSRSLTHLIVLTMYAFAIFSAMWVNDAWLEEQYHTMLYVLAFAIASVGVVMLLRLVKE